MNCRKGRGSREAGAGIFGDGSSPDKVVERGQQQGAKFSACAIGMGRQIVLQNFFDDEFLEHIIGLLGLEAAAADEMRGQRGAIEMQQSGQSFIVLGMSGITGLGDHGPPSGLKTCWLRLLRKIRHSHSRSKHMLKGQPGPRGG